VDHLIFSFLHEGAVCILTLENDPGLARSCQEASAPGGVPTNDDESAKPEVLCKTLIQLDGDVTSWVSPEVLAKPELLDEHYRAVSQQLQSASGHAQDWLRHVSTAGLAVRWAGGAALLAGNASLWHTLAGAALPLLCSALSLAGWHIGTRFAVSRLARRALRDLRALG
jgi:hypothetical protein